jgi:hypothetical protein
MERNSSERRRIVSAQIDQRLAQQLDALARDNDRSLSAEMRRALRAHVAGDESGTSGAGSNDRRHPPDGRVLRSVHVAEAAGTAAATVAVPDAVERRRVAWHEAGHIVASYLLGGTVGVASIRRTQWWNGIAHAHYEADEETMRQSLEAMPTDVALPLMPPELRRPFECEAMIALAGPIGEGLRPVAHEPHTGYVPLTEAERVIERARELTKTEGELISRGDADADTGDTDAAVAVRCCRFLSPDGAHEYLDLLWRETLRLLSTGGARKLLAALASELDHHTDLGAEDVLQVLQAADSI